MRTKAEAASAFLAVLVVLATTGAASGCRRPQPVPAPLVDAADAHQAVADAKPAAKRAAPDVPKTTHATSPEKPGSVPAEAFWVGGPDGGVFVFLERVHGRPSTFAGKIYHPDGELWYSGPFVPEPRGASIDPTQRDQFAGWDGERLLMSEGRWLAAVKTKRAHGPRRR